MNFSTVTIRGHFQRVRRNLSRLGFTLIEIMLVLGIMSIVLAMGLPAMVRVLDRDPLLQGVHDVEQGLRQARAQAILQGRRGEFVLDSDGNISVRVVDGAVPDSAAGESLITTEYSGRDSAALSSPYRAVLDPDVGVTRLEINRGPNLLDGPELPRVAVRFHPNGTSDEFTVDLEDATGAWRIHVDPVTARTEVVALR